MPSSNPKEYYEKLGFKSGIEIHAQLNIEDKLFCSCPAVLRTDEPHYYVIRYFRPVMGEMGVFDRALLIEYEKQHQIIYEGYHDTICTYELDETPPFPINQEAIDKTIAIASLLDLTVLDELHVCRKNYIDGSVTPGYQRTALVAIDGKLHLKKCGKYLGIQYIYLEEDAARKDNEKTKGKTVYFRLDRLGFPLIEIVTSPDLANPTEVCEAAQQLGFLLKSSGAIRRVLGAIRQDINVSITDGTRVELKGLQHLDRIPKGIDMEIERQKALIEIRDDLKDKNLSKENIELNIQDITDIFKKTNCDFLVKEIKSGGKILTQVLPKMKGFLGREIQSNKRFGTELADRVKAFTSLRGLLHSDEQLIEYKISEEEISKIQKQLKIGPDDAFILVSGNKLDCERALNFVVERIKLAFDGVPEETRRVAETGVSTFLRELHGRSRLYPDTDSPPVVILSDRVENIQASLEDPRETLERLQSEYDLRERDAEVLIDAMNVELFEKAVARGMAPNIVLTTLTQTVIALRREEVPIENLTDELTLSIFEALSKKQFSKEAIPEVIAAVAKEPTEELTETIVKLGLGAIPQEELEQIIEKILDDKAQLLREQGQKAHGPLMGLVMTKCRGKIDGKTIAQTLNKAIKKRLEVF
ncbi:MAG: Glu-tRNA(Gln) amidotransferase subunit GatE [Promethearchaeota archaeon]